MTDVLSTVCAGLVVMNTVAFALMWLDKNAAMQKRKPVPETVLFLATALFGGLGGTIGMLGLNHMVHRWYYLLGYPLLAFLQYVLLGYVTDMRFMLLLFVLVMNVAAFVLMGIDKNRAKNGQWRIPEKNLFLTTALFGGLGGMLGMAFFRHKTKHWYFTWGYALLMLIQSIILTFALIMLPT